MSRARRVLLLNPPARELCLRDNYCSFTSKADYYWPPIDLLVLSGLLRADYDVHFLDCTVDHLSTQDCIAFILARDIGHVIALTGTASLQEDAKALAEVARVTHPQTLLVSGGNLLTQHQEYLARFPFVDGVITNYAINDVPQFLNGERDAPSLNIVTRDHSVSGNVSGHVIAYPPPYHELFLKPRYRNPLARTSPFTSVLTSFGCPHRCTYCIGSILPYHRRDIDNLCQELEYLRELGVRELWFNDWTFNVGGKHPLAVCQALIEGRFDFGWHCQCRVDNLDEDLVAAMKKAGCHTVQIGVESGDQAILDRYAKGITLEQVRRAFALFKKYGIQTLGYFMIGLPGETRHSAEKTIALSTSLGCDYASFAITTPDIGTRLREECLANGWIPEDLETFDSTVGATIRTDALEPREIVALRNKAVRDFYFRPSYFLARLGDIRSPSDLAGLVQNGLKLVRNILKP